MADRRVEIQKGMTLVLLETPFAGDVERNLAFLDDCMRDSLLRGEAPFASHRLYTTALDDLIPEEREIGITAGLVWGELAEKTVVYVNLGISPGMRRGIDRALECGRIIEYRELMPGQYRRWRP